MKNNTFTIKQVIALLVLLRKEQYNARDNLFASMYVWEAIHEGTQPPAYVADLIDSSLEHLEDVDTALSSVFSVLSNTFKELWLSGVPAERIDDHYRSLKDRFEIDFEDHFPVETF